MSRLPVSTSLTKLLVLAALALAPRLQAVESVYTASTRQDPLGPAGASARAIGLGSAYVGVSDDASALFWNPAGLTQLAQPEVALHHLSGLAGIQQDTFAAAFPTRKAGVFGLYGHFVDYGTFEGFDASGIQTADYKARQMTLDAGWAKKLVSTLSAGFSLRSTQQTLGPNSYALFNGDIGLLLTSDSGWRLGASYLNLPLSAGSSSGASAFLVGASYFHDRKGPFTLLVAGAGSIEPHTGSRVQVGAEGGWVKSVFVRAGYEFNLQDTGLDKPSGFTAGAGLAVGPLRADYAYMPFGELGSTSRISLSYRFAPPKAPATPTPSPSPVVTPAVTAVPAPIVIAPPPSAPAQAPAVTAPSTSAPTPETGASGDQPALTLEFSLPSDDLAKAQALEKQGKIDEAFKIYLSLVQKDRDNAKAWSALGNIYFKSGMKAQAVRCFNEVLRIHPERQDLKEWLERYQSKP